MTIRRSEETSRKTNMEKNLLEHLADQNAPLYLIIFRSEKEKNVCYSIRESSGEVEKSKNA